MRVGFTSRTITVFPRGLQYKKRAVLTLVIDSVTDDVRIAESQNPTYPESPPRAGSAGAGGEYKF